MHRALDRFYTPTLIRPDGERWGCKRHLCLMEVLP
jgi:hypothetical protein